MRDKPKRPKQSMKGRKTKGLKMPVVTGVTKAPKNL